MLFETRSSIIILLRAGILSMSAMIFWQGEENSAENSPKIIHDVSWSLRIALFTWVDWSSHKFNIHELNKEPCLAVWIPKLHFYLLRTMLYWSHDLVNRILSAKWKRSHKFVQHSKIDSDPCTKKVFNERRNAQKYLNLKAVDGWI